MIDSHCHLDHEPLLGDLINVIKRSKEVGIKKLLTISTSYESFDRIKNIIQKDEMIYGTIGIHPHETTKNKITSDIIVKNINENDINFASVGNNEALLKGSKLNKIDILFKKIDKNND